MSTPAQLLNQHIQQQISQVVFGMQEAVEILSIALIAGGHVLLEGVPGLGKTLLAKSFSTINGGEFKRIQCTADLMPSDMTGIHIFRSDKSEFELVPGPVFADILLVDEINRTGPKTQSALLQAMEERKVTIDRSTYPLPKNFMVIASQNPVDFEGTYPLPESQLDRFLMRLLLVYPDKETETQVLKSYDKPGAGHEDNVNPLQTFSNELLEKARLQATEVYIADNIYQYAIDIARTSRAHSQVSLGLSTRGTLSLMKCARVRAALNGVDFVTPDDVKHLAYYVMGHRLQLTPDAALDGQESKDIVTAILSNVEVPRE